MVKSLVGLHPAFSLEAFAAPRLGGSHRQPLVQGRTFGEETGLLLPEVDALSVVHLTPGMGHGLQACCQGLSGQGAGGGFPMAVIFRL